MPKRTSKAGHKLPAAAAAFDKSPFASPRGPATEPAKGGNASGISRPSLPLNERHPQHSTKLADKRQTQGPKKLATEARASYMPKNVSSKAPWQMKKTSSPSAKATGGQFSAILRPASRPAGVANAQPVEKPATKGASSLKGSSLFKIGADKSASKGGSSPEKPTAASMIGAVLHAD